MVDSAKCPHCGAVLTGTDIGELEVENDDVRPMGLGDDVTGVLFVCPSCDTILG